MGVLRATLAIAALDLRRRLRNRSFVVQAVVAPIGLAAIITAAFGGGVAFHTTIAVVDADRSSLSRDFTRAVLALEVDGLEFRSVPTVEGARRRLGDGIGSAIVVPRGFADSLAGDRPAAVEVVASPDLPLSRDLARAVAAELTSRAAAARLAAATTTALGGDEPDPAALASIDLPVTVAFRGSGDDVSPAAYFGPSMALLFLFLSLGTVGRDLLVERRLGVLARIRATPAGTSPVVAGKILSVLVVSAVSLVTVWLATTVALGARWGDAAGVSLLIVATSLAVAAIAALVAGVARTVESAEILAGVVAFGFALVGGSFVPLGDLPEASRRLALLTPNGWALRGFAELSAGGGGVGDVVPHAAVLAAWAAVAGTVAARLVPRRLEAA